MSSTEYLTTDLCDAHEDKVRVLEPLLASYGGRAAFHGRIATLKLHEDNSLVRKAVESPGEGRVLVIDGGGSLRRALVGDQLAALAVKNGWAGIIVYGCIRDSRAIGEMDLGVLALDTHPLKTVKRNVGEADIAVTFGGVTFVPGEWLYADDDGVIVSSQPLHGPAAV
jgi:regulator of ribonuclease activity A